MLCGRSESQKVHSAKICKWDHLQNCGQENVEAPRCLQEEEDISTSDLKGCGEGESLVRAERQLDQDCVCKRPHHCQNCSEVGKELGNKYPNLSLFPPSYYQTGPPLAKSIWMPENKGAWEIESTEAGFLGPCAGVEWMGKERQKENNQHITNTLV